MQLFSFPAAHGKKLAFMVDSVRLSRMAAALPGAHAAAELRCHPNRGRPAAPPTKDADCQNSRYQEERHADRRSQDRHACSARRTTAAENDIEVV
jgi:hypothetical protein